MSSLKTKRALRAGAAVAALIVATAGGFAALHAERHSDAKPETAAMARTIAPEGAAHRKIKYYRNAMGLPDTSPVPKKDAMGMDYVPVYEDEDNTDGSVELSAGKIQRSGVRSEPAELHRIRTLVRAPGTIQV